MRVALAQIAPKLSCDNFSKHFDYINKAIEQKCDLIVFPELSLNGYTLKDATKDFAFKLQDLESIINKSDNIDIIVGFVFFDEGLIYNAAAYISKNKIIHIHKKVSLPNYGMFEEARFFHKGKLVKEFEVDGINALILICEDVWDESILDFDNLEKIDILYVIANSPARDFLDDGSLDIEKKWQNKLTRYAKIFDTKVVFVNRVGFEDGMGFWGGSRVVDRDGTIIKRADLFDEVMIIQEI